MKRKFSYSIGEMNRRLLAIGKSIRGYLVISTLSSIIGALAHMGLMGFGALWLLAAAGFCGNFALYGILTVGCAILIAVSRYLEGVFSHMGAYGILAKMRVQLFDSIDRVAPAWLIGRETGDLMNIAVSDIETLEFFFAHTIGPMFTVILLPLTTVILAFCVNPLYAWVLIPIYLMISVVLPFSALKAGRGIGMRYRERLGILKSKILESVYSIRDIQIFGAGERKAEEIQRANDEVNHASFWLTLHRQTVASFPNFFVYLARILILVCAGVLASRGINNPVGTIALSFAATASLSSTFNLTFVVTSLLETYGAAERIFQIEDTLPETTEPESPVSCGEIQTIEFRDVSFSYPDTEKKILDHMNLIIKKGDQIGIEGESGAGKSTILKMITEVAFPTTGEIKVNGRVSALLELTSGFDPEFTGRENIYLKGQLLGLDTEEIKELEPVIIEFAQLGDYIDQPVRTYSSGMKARLGFSINVNIRPEILIVDEALSVGDEAFKNKCIKKVNEIIKNENVTLLFVTHATGVAKEFCKRGMVMESGVITFDGNIAEAIEKYNSSIK